MGNASPKASPRAVAPVHDVVVVVPRSTPADVMVVPLIHTMQLDQVAGDPAEQARWEVLHENRAFADQWAAAAPDREVVAIPVVSPGQATVDQLRTVLEHVAPMAATRELIWFVGHGGMASRDNSPCFDTIPQRGPFAKHACVVQEEAVMNAHAIWAAQRPPRSGAGTAGSAHPLQTRSDPLAQLLVDAGALFEAKGITRFTLLTCNAGSTSSLRPPLPGHLSGREFVQQLADVLRTPVRAYRGRVVTGEDRRPLPPGRARPIQIWVTEADDDHGALRDQPNSITRPESLHEVPDANPLSPYVGSITCTPSP